jgi:hypothetical protein
MQKLMCRCTCNSYIYESLLLQHHRWSPVLKIVQFSKLGCVHLYMFFCMPAHPFTSVYHQ